MSTLAKADLSDEELATAIVQAESLLNTRPITAVRCWRSAAFDTSTFPSWTL